jgi:hypothetical protein
MRRREVNPIGVSFLDCICCGFGAIILMYVIVSARAATVRNEVIIDRRAEVNRLEFEVFKGQKDLVRARNALDDAVLEAVRTEGRSRRLIEEIRTVEEEIAERERATLAQREHENKLNADIESVEAELNRLRAAAAVAEREGQKLREFKGTGDRHYLTGLKVGGRRVLILLDCSASMLDDTIVGVLRRRNMGDEEKRRSDKWRQAVRTVDWLTTQFPLGTQFQVMGFSETAFTIAPGSEGRWLDASVAEDLARPIEALAEVVPAGGTSLLNAFDAIGRLPENPDNIILLTDGLPTMGARPPSAYKVTPKTRLSLFRKAVATLPSGVPVNVILLPMEGDPRAASAFWRLAIDTRGSFFCPAGDWP